VLTAELPGSKEYCFVVRKLSCSFVTTDFLPNRIDGFR